MQRLLRVAVGWCVIVTTVALSLDLAAQTSPPRPNTAQPLRTPPTHLREIPELVCQSERELRVRNDTLETTLNTTPLRLRIRGTFLYAGENAGNEKFWSTITRNDRRRWIAGTSTLILDESLSSGTWTQVEAASIAVRTLSCMPFDSSRR
jgi:hypothetical protein